MEITPGVHVITVGAGAFVGVYPPNVYLVLGKSGAAFIDSGYNKAKDVKARLGYLQQVGNPSVKAVVLTHRHGDHMGGALPIARSTGASILSHPEEKAPIEKAMKELNKRIKGGEVHHTVQDRETLSLGNATLEFLHTPGHTLGSLSVYLRESKVLFTGDTILGMGTTVINADEGDLGAYLDSLRKLLTCPATLLCPGHGPVVRTPKTKVQELLQHRLEREEQVLSALRQGVNTVEEMLTVIYPELDQRLHDQAKTQIRAHLAKLEQEGRVSHHKDAYRLRQG